MEGGRFRVTGNYGYARATEVLNTKRTDEVVWSVKIFCEDETCDIGIATKLPQFDDWIDSHDENAIFYDTSYGSIQTGKEVLHEDIMIGTEGDEIHCRFQPKLKKFLISFVSSIRFTLLYLDF